MSVWAIGDLHLSFGVPNKKMSVFGNQWEQHAEKIARHWQGLISPDDLVLIPGDISWAMHLEEALPDLEWIHKLPGTKVMIKGNHDYWWSSMNKISKVMPPSIHIVHNNAFHWKNISIGGARMWDTPEYSFGSYINFVGNPLSKGEPVVKEEDSKIFTRELHRLELSLQSLQPEASIRIAMTHYPPISADLQPSLTSALLEKYRINVCVFGHLHQLKPNLPMFGERHGIRYLLTSCDYLDFKPVKVF